ncbi:MAG: hypothetical protein IPL76_03240 [Gemmatimonadetes bacterium]|nr:hypothetical protein [Gemmatimonadota bacterium]
MLPLRIEGFGVGFSVTDVGSGTLLDYVQVAGRPGQPISAALGIVGGGLGLRHLVLGPEIAGPAITYTGWSGKGQFLLMRPRVVAGGWLLHAILPSATPPQLYNVTVASPARQRGGGVSQFSAGGNGVMRNALFYQTGNALQLRDAATCDEILAGRLDITHSLFLALTSPGTPTSIPRRAAATSRPTSRRSSSGRRPGAIATSRMRRPPPPKLTAPDEPTLWDLRPIPGSLATTGGATPERRLLRPAATYVGRWPPRWPPAQAPRSRGMPAGSGAAAGPRPRSPRGVWHRQLPLAGPLAG